jgi:hypothetical protein
MRFLRFLAVELGLRGIVFTVVGTVALVGLYLLSVGAPPEQYLKSAQSFVRMVTLSPEFSIETAGFSTQEIISSGAAITFPLALVSLIFLVLVALIGSATAASSSYLEMVQAGRKGFHLGGAGSLIASLLSAVPLFVGFWMLYFFAGMTPPLLLIAIVTVALGGLGWDAAKFLTLDMKRQIDMTHTLVFSTLGPPVGRVFPLPGTVTGYLLNSCAPRFLPYVAGKVPAIIGGVTIAEMVFNFPGLGSTLLDALVNRLTDTLIASVFILLAVNALVILLVKFVLFILYPRSYEKAL